MLLAPAVRGEVVLPDQPGRGGVQRGPGRAGAARPACRAGAAARRPSARVGDPVLVAAAQGREPGVEVGRHLGQRRAPARRRAAARPAGAAARRRAAATRSAGRSTWQTWPVACTPASVRPATVSPVAVPAPKTSVQRLGEHPGDGAPARLGRPAGEVGAVVRDVEPQPDPLVHLRTSVHAVGPGTPAGVPGPTVPWTQALFVGRPRRCPRGRRRCRRTSTLGASASSVGRAASAVSSAGASASTLSCCAALRAAVFLAALAGGRRPDELLDQLDDRHRRGVALARAGLHDPGVAAVAVGVPRRDLVEQGVDHVLVAGPRSAPGGARAGRRAWPW